MHVSLGTIRERSARGNTKSTPSKSLMLSFIVIFAGELRWVTVSLDDVTLYM